MKPEKLRQCLEAPLRFVPTEAYFPTPEMEAAARLALLEELAILKKLYFKAPLRCRYGCNGAPTPWVSALYGDRLLGFRNSLAAGKYVKACEFLADVLHSECAFHRAAIYTWIQILEGCFCAERRAALSATSEGVS